MNHFVFGLLGLTELGANDGLRGLSPQEMHKNLSEIIAKAEKSGAKVLLLSMKIPPNYGARYIEMFYKIYPQLAGELHIPLVPCSPLPFLITCYLLPNLFLILFPVRVVLVP